MRLLQVQQRIAELIRVIDSLLVEMQTQGAHWISFLDKLAVVNVLHTQVQMFALLRLDSMCAHASATASGTAA